MALVCISVINTLSDIHDIELLHLDKLKLYYFFFIFSTGTLILLHFQNIFKLLNFLCIFHCFILIVIINSRYIICSNFHCENMANSSFKESDKNKNAETGQNEIPNKKKATRAESCRKLISSLFTKLFE